MKTKITSAACNLNIDWLILKSQIKINHLPLGDLQSFQNTIQEYIVYIQINNIW